MGKVGETNHKITGERTDGLLCLWWTQSLVPREENPRKQSGGGLQVPVLHWRGISRALLGTPGSPIWSVGLSVPTQSTRQGDLSSLGTGISLFLYGSFQNTFVVTRSPWEERQLSMGYILAVDDCSLLDLLAPTSVDGEIIVWNVETVAASESHCMSLSERAVQ